ncbi:MAG: sulfite exporter TauE/SafE family protein [Actinomycetota bacterium]
MPDSGDAEDVVDPLTAVALVVFAIAIGVYGTVIGAGGGFLLIPGLVLLFDLEGVEAVGTGAVTLAAIGLGGARTYDRAGLVDRSAAFWFAVGSVPSALFFSAVVADRIDGEVFVDLLGALLLALAVFVVAMPTTPDDQGPPSRRSLQAMPAGGVVVGFLGGTFAVGGGLVTLPFVGRLRRLTPHRAAATTSATAMLSSLASSTGHTIAGNVAWSNASVLVIGALIGSTLGARHAGRLPARLVLALVAAGLIVTGVAVLLR